MLYLKEDYAGAGQKAAPAAADTPLSPSHALLARAAALYTGRTPEEFGPPALSARGKPYFPDCPALFFSISHSGTLWACAMAAAEVGLDIQEPRKQDAARIARRFFHPQEQAYLERRGMDAFFRVWAAKESFCKFRGTGIDGSFSQFSVTDGERLLAQTDGVSLTHFLTREGYAACLASQEEAHIVIRYL